MHGENEHLSVMMKMNQEVASVQGQIDRVEAELASVGNDPRHVRRKKELQIKLNKLKSALYKKFK